MKHLNIKISGRVQAVFFRVNAKRKADELDIKGFVRNEPDASVYIEAEGDEESLKKFVDWCNRGPRLARVDGVDAKEDSVKDFEKFTID